MAKEKVFRSGKKNRPKKKKKSEEKKKESHWSLWGKDKNKRSHHRRKRKRDSQQPKLKESQNNFVQPTVVRNKKKKSKLVTTDKWTSWNRAQTTGLSAEELYCEITITVTPYHVLTEVSLAIDHEKIALLKKQKHNRNLVSILSRIP